MLSKRGKDGSSDKNFRVWVLAGVMIVLISKGKKKLCNQKKLKKLKWSRTGSFCILLLLICKPRLSPPFWVQQTSHGRIHSIQCQFSAFKTAGPEGRSAGPQERSDILGSRRPHGDTAVLRVVTLKPHAQGLNVTARQILTSDRVWRNSCGYFQEFMN